jgi:hypothetical protein
MKWRIEKPIKVLCAVVLVSLSAACGNTPVGPSQPIAQPPASPAPAPPPAPSPRVPSWPEISRPARIYVADFAYPLGYPTRFVIYDNSEFSLQFSRSDDSVFEYPGNYSETDGSIEFRFKANNGAWGATATVNEETLHVRYNFDMVMSDFVDGKYARVR